VRKSRDVESFGYETHDGISARVEIYRISDKEGWWLEVIDERGDLTRWDATSEPSQKTQCVWASKSDRYPGFAAVKSSDEFPKATKISAR
jgi:hypothetical protein